MVNRNSSCSSFPLRIQILLVLSLLFSPAVLAKSRRPISDIETRQKKTQCYADIDSGLWGWQCKSTMIAKENCVLKCLSPTCYELVYESDPLEEGEKDLRGQEFKYCMHKDLNRACPKDEFPLPNMDMLIDSTSGQGMLSFMDGISCYNQINMATRDAEKTAFRTPYGNFHYTVMSFGLKNAGATYQRAMTAYCEYNQNDRGSSGSLRFHRL